MVVEAEFIWHPTVAFQCLRVSPSNIRADFFDMAQPDTAAPLSVDLSGHESMPLILDMAQPDTAAPLSVDLSGHESALSCSTSLQISRACETLNQKFVPKIRPGSNTDIGPRSSNEDEHISIGKGELGVNILDADAYRGSATWV